MPLTLPNLDDRTYDDLVKEALELIPAHAPEWTNHNPSDPGITLIEMFAYLTEMLIYRVNRVGEVNYLAFLKLIMGPDWTPSSSKTLTEQIRGAVLQLRAANRAVTCDDFERLAREANPHVIRSRCVPRRDLASGFPDAPDAEVDGCVSVVIVPDTTNAQAQTQIIQIVRDYLEPRRLLTTQVSIVGPRYFGFGVQLAVALKPDLRAEIYLNITLDSSLESALDTADLPALQTAFAPSNVALSAQTQITIHVPHTEWLISDPASHQQYLVRKETGRLEVYEDRARGIVINALRQFFDPLTGGENHEGWPFGRNVYVSEVYQLLDSLPGIDYVTQSMDPATHQLLPELTANADRLLVNEQGDLIAVKLQSDELIDLSQLKVDLMIQANQENNGQ